MKVTALPGQRLAADYPEAFTNKHVAILGTTGAGKTTVAKVAIVEPLLDRGQRVHIIDPKTDWWGLRLAADGKKPGYKIYIFGGERGDYPLRVADTQSITEAFAASSDSAVFDTSKLHVEERMQFFIKYAETILHKNKGPLNIVVDEAHLFMPQQGAKIGGQAPRMLHAGNNMVSLGRSKGLRVAMLTQRPQKLHKDSLTLAQALIALRVFHPLDRKALVEWMDEQAGGVSNTELLESLSGLKPGEGWAWSPTDSFLERAQFPLPRTFDSSKAPEMGDADVPTLEPINLQDLTGKLGKIEEERKANDPKLLQARIRELEHQAKFLPKVEPMRVEIPVADPVAIERAFSEGLRKGWRAAYRVGQEDGIGEVQDLIQTMTEAVSDLPSPTDRQADEALRKFLTASPDALKYDAPIPQGSPRRPGDGLVPHPPARKPSETARMPVSRPPPTVSDGGTLTWPQQKVVSSLAFWEHIGNSSPSRAQVAFVAGYSPNSSTFQNLIGSMRSAGMIDYPSQGYICLRIEGQDVMSAQEARDMMFGVLSAPQRKLIEAMPHDAPATRESLARATDYSANSSTFQNLVGRLNTLGIFEKSGPGQISLAEWAVEVLR